MHYGAHQKACIKLCGRQSEVQKQAFIWYSLSGNPKCYSSNGIKLIVSDQVDGDAHCECDMQISHLGMPTALPVGRNDTYAQSLANI